MCVLIHAHTYTGVSVYEARLNMGKKLAEKIIKLYGPDHGINAVIPVPDTARTSALECAETLGVPYREGFIKNRYIGRTFIMPGQTARRKGVRMKLNTVKSEFEGRCVLLVDDSIVRGTTATELVNMSRESGAVDVCIASAAPEVLHANVYGIDIPTRGQLISYHRDAQEVAVKWPTSISWVSGLSAPLGSLNRIVSGRAIGHERQHYAV